MGLTPAPMGRTLGSTVGLVAGLKGFDPRSGIPQPPQYFSLEEGDTMSPQAENMLARMRAAGLPIPAPSNPGLDELLEAGLITAGDIPPDQPYPDDYRVWTLVS